MCRSFLIDVVSFVYFFLHFPCLRDILEIILLCKIPEVLLPMFSSKIFMVLWLTFKTFIHFEFILVYGSLFHLFFCIYHSRPPSTICWRGYFYSVLCFYPLCQILMTIEIWVYFWALYSVPLIYVSVLMPLPGCFDYNDLTV